MDWRRFWGKRNIPFIHFDQLTLNHSRQAIQEIAVARELGVAGAARPLPLRAACVASSMSQPDKDDLFVGPCWRQPVCRRYAAIRAAARTGQSESVERGALHAMRYWLEGRKTLPDLMWFGDDFVARGPFSR